MELSFELNQEEEFGKRLYKNLAEFREDRKIAINHLGDLIDAMKSERIDKAFSESVNLAVTQVNGCELCSNTHAEGALKAGMSAEEVDSLLAGSFENAPKEQKVALFFARHYAESKGNPNAETWQRVVDTYGVEKSKDIMAFISIIMLANIHGNTLAAFKLRLKGEPVKKSSLWNEISVLIGFFKIILFAPKALLEQAFRKKTNQLAVEG